MSEQVEVLTLLFADISGSTRIIQDYGDHEARELIQRCLERVASAVRGHDGQVRGRIGDELMCTFRAPQEAIRAALDIQASVKAGADGGELPAALRMHIGLHQGPILIERDQIFGDTIHVAKRMVDLAKTDQILTTRGTLDAAGSMPEVRARLTDQVRIKGYDIPVEIYEVMRQDPSVTLVAHRATIAATGEHYVRCRLRHRGLDLALDEGRPILTIGREPDNDLVVPAGCISRHHARIELQKGRVILVDQSTNGTWILEDGGPEPVLAHREQRWLRGTGQLRLGQPRDDDSRLSIAYGCEGVGETAFGPAMAPDGSPKTQTP